MVKLNKTNWEWVEPKTLKKDGANPNKMSKEQKEALKANITRFGWNMPIITDMKLVIADGEQKLDVALEMGLKEVPILKKKLTVTERKIIRQSMNKLKGSHDDLLDAEEFKKILQNSDMEELEKLTAISQQEILNLLEKSERDISIDSSEVDQLYTQEVTCPKCGHKFKKSKQE